MSKIVPEAMAAMEALLAAERGRMLWVLSRCDSPIEQIFVADCFSRGWEWSGTEAEWEATVGAPLSVGFRDFLSRGSATIFTQIEIPKLHARVDFMFVASGKETLSPIVVELDGHDFHERTKEQAKRDKSRDRAMTALGWRVLRFTGSEIVRDVRACVDEVEGLLWGVAR